MNPARAVVFSTAATGLRISEALGLKWSDVDFSSGVINLSRAVVHQHIGETRPRHHESQSQWMVPHANSRLTLDVYAQALTPAKRAAHLKVVEMIRPTEETLVVPSCSQIAGGASLSD